jgi:hypothetical protein
MGTTTQNITQTTSNIGPAQQPYFTAGMQRAQSLLTDPYRRYTDKDGKPIGRIAGFTDQQKNVQNQTAGMQTPGQFGAATNMATQAGLGVLNTGNYDPTQFNVQTVNNPQLQYMQMDKAQQFGNDQAQQYMSPYFQNVLDVQKRKAQEDAQQTQLMQNLGAASQGTYGGSRQLMAGLVRERDLGRQMGDIQATGQQAAYENAQKQFNADRAAGFSVDEANLRAALGVQELGARNDLAAQQSNQQYGLEGQRLGEQSRQYGATHDMDRYKTASDMAQTLANIGYNQQNADIARLGLQRSSAAEQQALDQQKLDLAYKDFQNETNDPYNKLQQYMNLLSAVPQAKTVTETSSAPTPSLGQQILGAGVGAAGIYNMVK